MDTIAIAKLHLRDGGESAKSAARSRQPRGALSRQSRLAKTWALRRAAGTAPASICSPPSPTVVPGRNIWYSLRNRGLASAALSPGRNRQIHDNDATLAHRTIGSSKNVRNPGRLVGTTGELVLRPAVSYARRNPSRPDVWPRHRPQSRGARSRLAPPAPSGFSSAVVGVNVRGCADEPDGFARSGSSFRRGTVHSVSRDGGGMRRSVPAGRRHRENAPSSSA